MLKPGDTFDRYTIDAAIGHGGMGSVYRAHDARLDRRVALKVIADGSTTGDGAERLLREARAAASLDHPNAVSIFDVGELGGAPYIVMELVPGRTLREVIGGDGDPVATRVAWLTDTARALAAAHRRGIVHRDVKPENVMVRDDGVVKVLDFGIARRAAGQVDGQVDAAAPTQSPAMPTLTREGIKVGTPVYMAPEQIRGDALDGRADQFAWGVLAYELLTGKPPWRGGGEPLAVVASILTDDVASEPLARAGVSEPVAAVVHRALAKKPDDRFASMDDLLRALEGAARGESPEPRVEPPRRVAAPAASVRPPVAGQATLLQRYSTGEVQEILARAVEQQASRGDSRLGFEDLVAAAGEVGVDPEVLRQASREIRARQAMVTDEGAARDAWIRRKRRRFYGHLGVWVIVNLAFVLIGLVEGSSRPFQMMVPGLFWGMGVAIQGLRAFMAGEDEWREEREREARKERKKQRRSQSIDRAIDEGVSVLIKAGEALSQRMETPAPAPGSAAPVSRREARRRVADVARVPGAARIAGAGAADDGAARDAAAEEEAAAEESARRSGRRRR